jgi:hypothetical protein
VYGAPYKVVWRKGVDYIGTKRCELRHRRLHWRQGRCISETLTATKTICILDSLFA